MEVRAEWKDVMALLGHCNLSVNPYLTSGASVRPEKDITYSTGNEGPKVCVDFSEAALLQIYRYTASCVVGY